MIYWDALPSRRWNLTPAVWVWALHSNFFAKSLAWNGVLHSDEHNKHPLRQMIRVNTNSDNHADSTYPRSAGVRMALYLHSLPPTNPQRQSDREKNTRLIPMEGPSTNTWIVLLKIFQVVKHNENLRNGHSLEKPKETRRLNVLWYSRWNAGTERGR